MKLALKVCFFRFSFWICIFTWKARCNSCMISANELSLNLKIPVTHDIVFSGCTVEILSLLSDLRKTARSPGSSIRSAICDWFVYLYNPIFPVRRVISVFSGSASTLNVVPNTRIPIPSVWTIKGFFSSLRTSKNASPFISTCRTCSLNSLG